ncbi:hypothetical protein GCM10010182_40840 [Actinomadura cremea]|nr:hypothetical protein GCM10010182_40840 [Actinomadura cremea]
MGRQAPAEQTIERYWLVKPGDLIVNPMWLVGGGIGVSGIEGAVSPDYRVYELSREVYPKYLHYLLRSDPYRDQYRLYTRADTTFDRRVSKENFHSMPIVVPPMEEQRRIANFLDAETSRLDALVDKVQAQMHLFEERELAQIHAALRGSMVAGARKDSGMEWLGDVPSSWPVASVSSQFQVQLGKMLNQERSEGAHLRPYLRVLNVQWDFIDTADLVEMDFPPTERVRYEVLPGDLLICEGGSYPGRAAVWDGRISEIYFQKALHRARSRGRSSVRWLLYCLRLALAMGVFHAEGNSTTITHLTGEQLAARRFPFPESDVQQRIVADLDAERERMQSMYRARERQVELLEERRRALITAAVTGQLDVTTARVD